MSDWGECSFCGRRLHVDDGYYVEEPHGEVHICENCITDKENAEKEEKMEDDTYPELGNNGEPLIEYPEADECFRGESFIHKANKNFAIGNYHIYVSRNDRRTTSNKSVLNSIIRHLKHIVKITFYSHPLFDRRREDVK